MLDCLSAIWCSSAKWSLSQLIIMEMLNFLYHRCQPRNVWLSQFLRRLLLVLQNAGVLAQGPGVQPESGNTIIKQFNNGLTFTQVLNILFLITQCIVPIINKFCIPEWITMYFRSQFYYKYKNTDANLFKFVKIYYIILFSAALQTPC